MINIDPNDINLNSDDMREYVATRDQMICQLCGKTAHHQHHITPKSQGGVDTCNNRVCLCIDCHKVVHCDTLFYVGRLTTAVVINEIRFRFGVSL